MSRPRQNPSLGWLEQQVSELKKRNRKLKQELLRDELTGLYNSRSLKLRLEACLKERFEAGLGPAVLFIDIDHFKGVNELHGHRAGGELLSQMGRLLAQNTRKGDIAFRYGGDEFVLLVSGGAKGAWRAGERIRKQIEKHEFRLDGFLKEKSIRLTVSVGYHVMGIGDTTAQILDYADRAMFEAKRKSRNKVISSAA